MNPQVTSPAQALSALGQVPNLPEWIGTAAGVYLFFNGHQVIGAALATWMGYQAITGKSPLGLLGGAQ
jgi:hypothetical protein